MNPNVKRMMRMQNLKKNVLQNLKLKMIMMPATERNGQVAMSRKQIVVMKMLRSRLLLLKRLSRKLFHIILKNLRRYELLIHNI